MKLHNISKSILVNKLEVPTRIIMGSMHLNIDSKQEFERKAQYYGALAKNDIGIIITAGASPDMAGRAGRNSFSIDEDETIPKHKLITQSVHKNNGRIFMQILHFGREGFHKKIVSSSPNRLEGNFYVPKELTEEQIFETIKSYGRAAARAVIAGYDGIELLFGQGFLIHQFLSPHINVRTDSWGGSFENRKRFALLVAKEVREAVGYDYPIIFRIPCLDLIDGAVTHTEAMELIDDLSRYQIDLLNLSIGWHEAKIPTIAYNVPTNGFALVANYVRKKFPEIKISASNRINDLIDAERIIQSGAADMVSMARPFLADPEIVKKSLNGNFSGINKCIACNQDCLDNVMTGREVSCAVNPSTLQYPVVVQKANEKKNIAVIGAGVAGLSAAYYLLMAGHDVSIYEKDHALGGQVQLAAMIPNKHGFLNVVNYFKNEINNLNGKIILGHCFDPENAVNYDAIVCSIGGVAKKIEENIATDNSVEVYSYEDVFANKGKVSFPVVVIGGGGVACDVAKYLYTENDILSNSQKFLSNNLSSNLFDELNHFVERPKVSIVQRSKRKIAYKLGRTTRWINVKKIQEMNIDVHKRFVFEKIENGNIYFKDKKDGSPLSIEASSIVFCIGQNIDESYLDQIKKYNSSVFDIGSCKESKAGASISLSIRQGYEVASKI